MGPKFKNIIVRLVKNQYFLIATCYVPKESKFYVDKYLFKKHCLKINTCFKYWTNIGHK